MPIYGIHHYPNHLVFLYYPEQAMSKSALKNKKKREAKARAQQQQQQQQNPHHHHGAMVSATRPWTKILAIVNLANGQAVVKNVYIAFFFD